MTSIKTAISVQDALFQRADEIANEMNISRSRLYNLALEEFVIHYQNRKILDQINEAFQDLPDPDEGKRRHKMMRIQKHLVEGEWK